MTAPRIPRHKPDYWPLLGLALIAAPWVVSVLSFLVLASR